jgi:alpha,alpha-trehalose-phosphate synthase [UDP-forming]
LPSWANKHKNDVNTLRLQLRFLLPLLLTLGLAAYLALPLMDQLTLRWFSRDLNLRGELVTNALADAISDAMVTSSTDRLQSMFDRAAKDERIVGIGLCTREGILVRKTDGFPAGIECERVRSVAILAPPVLAIAGGTVHVGVHPVQTAASVVADLVLLRDLSFIERRSQDTRKYLIVLIAVLGAAMAFITVLVAQLSWRGWVAGIRGLLRGEVLLRPLAPGHHLAPLAADLRLRLRDLEDEYRRGLGPEVEWDADRLRWLLRTKLRGDEVIVLSNREPYIHELGADGKPFVRRPASGLVTAIEPVMRACSGTWVAHGGGSGDAQAVDDHDRLQVPPGRDEYTLRRIWLTPEEEQGYYYGFANEGLWPLCHVAHVRPVFRESDWLAYRQVNRRFADAVIAEARSDDPIVLVQDYHFALVPAMIRERLPGATILTFWHIPWPNPESFGICPWRRELLQGLLGSTILGFHTRFHCKNFMETVDRYLEARIEQEHSIVSVQNTETYVESYPISIEWPTQDSAVQWPSVADCRAAVIRRLKLSPEHRIAVGVDRFDYTKGILERLHAVERFLEKHPEWIGCFSLVQVAAPTRTSLEEYRAFQDRIERVCQRISARFGQDGYEPVILLSQHHEHDQLNELYRAADLCLVTSLHDGMNLVCKEFVAARNDEQGVLVLSRFAGAAREMTEALVVNPYHVEECADAILQALVMPAAEQRERMASLRMTVREFNVYRWAGRMLSDAARMRQRQRIEARVQRHSAPEVE